MSDIPTALRIWTEAMTRNVAQRREQEIRLVLQPRPRWLPAWAWKRIIARLLIIEEQDIAGSSQP